MFCQKNITIFFHFLDNIAKILPLQFSINVLNLIYMENLDKDYYLTSASVLAFVGDSVYSVIVRSALAKKHDFLAGKLNRLANLYVCAKAQARTLDKITPALTEREHDIVMRARNISPNNVPKSCTIAEYTMATALEALFGYLYLTKQFDRMNELITIGIGEIE